MRFQGTEKIGNVCSWRVGESFEGNSDVANTVEVGNPVFIYNDGNLLLSPSRTPNLWLHPGLGLGAAEDQARDFRAFTRNGL